MLMLKNTKHIIPTFTIALAISLILGFGFSNSLMAYSPPPGVLAPDEVDFGGRTITIMGEHLHESKFVEEGEIRENRLQEAKELFNIGDIVFYDGASFEPIMTRIMGGDATHDIYIEMGNRQQYWQLVTEGAFLPLNDILPDEYFEEYVPQPNREMLRALEYGGEQFAFKTHWATVRTGGMFYTLYNRTMIEEAGLPDPYDLYQEGSWTWENMGDIAIELTQDTTGDGEIDQYGMTSLGPDRVVYLAYTNNADTFEFQDGRATFAFDSPEAIETIRQVYEWTTEENITGGWLDEFTAGEVAFHPVEWLWAHRFPKADMEDEWDVVPMPMGPEATEHVFPSNDARGSFLPISAEDPEGLIALKHFLFRVEDRDPDRIASPAYVDRYMGTRQHLEVFETSQREWGGEIDMFTGTEYNAMIYEKINEAIQGEQSPTAAMEEVRPAAQSWLDELFDQ